MQSFAREVFLSPCSDLLYTIMCCSKMRTIPACEPLSQLSPVTHDPVSNRCFWSVPQLFRSFVGLVSSCLNCVTALKFREFRCWIVVIKMNNFLLSIV